MLNVVLHPIFLETSSMKVASIEEISSSKGRSLCQVSLERLSPEELYAMWTVATKAKGAIPEGHRLENLSWRLWFAASHSSQGNKRLKQEKAERNEIPRIEIAEDKDVAFAKILTETINKRSSTSSISLATCNSCSTILTEIQSASPYQYGHHLAAAADAMRLVQHSRQLVSLGAETVSKQTTPENNELMVVTAQEDKKSTSQAISILSPGNSKRASSSASPLPNDLNPSSSEQACDSTLNQHDKLPGDESPHQGSTSTDTMSGSIETAINSSTQLLSSRRKKKNVDQFIQRQLQRPHTALDRTLVKPATEPLKDSTNAIPVIKVNDTKEENELRPLSRSGDSQKTSTMNSEMFSPLARRSSPVPYLMGPSNSPDRPRISMITILMEKHKAEIAEGRMKRSDSCPPQPPNSHLSTSPPMRPGAPIPPQFFLSNGHLPQVNLSGRLGYVENIRRTAKENNGSAR